MKNGARHRSTGHPIAARRLVVRWSRARFAVSAGFAAPHHLDSTVESPGELRRFALLVGRVGSSWDALRVARAWAVVRK